jgi:hypothetical protein
LLYGCDRKHNQDGFLLKKPSDYKNDGVIPRMVKRGFLAMNSITSLWNAPPLPSRDGATIKKTKQTKIIVKENMIIKNLSFIIYNPINKNTYLF